MGEAKWHTMINSRRAAYLHRIVECMLSEQVSRIPDTYSPKPVRSGSESELQAERWGAQKDSPAEFTTDFHTNPSSFMRLILAPLIAACSRQADQSAETVSSE